MKTKFIGILSLLTAGTISGYIVGNRCSPDATKPETARNYLLVFSKWRRIDPDHGRVTLNAGSRTYEYTTGDASVTVRPMPPEEAIKQKVPRRDMDKDFDKLMGLTVAQTGGTGVLSTFMEGAAAKGTLSSFSKGEKVSIVVATGGSILLGFWIAYHPEPDVSEPKFEETLTSEVATWKTDEESWRKQYEKAVAVRVSELQPRRGLLLPADTLFFVPMDAGPCAAEALFGFTHPDEKPDDDRSPGSLRRSHPEICDQVGGDPRVLAALNPPAVPAPGMDSMVDGILALRSQPFPGLRIKTMPKLQPLPGRR